MGKLESWEYGDPQNIIDRKREKRERDRKKKARKNKLLTKIAMNKKSHGKFSDWDIDAS